MQSQFPDPFFFMTKPIAEQLEKIKKGAAEIISEQELIRKLEMSAKEKRPLRIKAGFDPSAPDLHLGHAVLLKKLRDFQDCGHQILFLIGDFTARIGDPTGKNELRKPLSESEVQKNSETYQRQVFRILDKSKTKVVFNEQWLGRMTPADFLKLTSSASVGQMLARADFSERYKAGREISIVEFLYPLLQAQDSVELKADVELGGTDQKFNLLMGRELQKQNGQEPQVVLMMPILEGLDGVQKMSKSLGNYIPLESGKDDAERAYNIFGPLMSVSDELMFRYYELLTDLSLKQIQGLRDGIKNGKIHPKKCKTDLARMITAQFYGDALAVQCGQLFEKRHGKENRGVIAAEAYEARHVGASELEGNTIWICKLLALIGAAKTNSDARRLVQQGGVTIGGAKIQDPSHKVTMTAKEHLLLTVGKKGFYKISVGAK